MYRTFWPICFQFYFVCGSDDDPTASRIQCISLKSDSFLSAFWCVSVSFNVWTHSVFSYRSGELVSSASIPNHQLLIDSNSPRIPQVTTHQ